MSNYSMSTGIDLGDKFSVWVTLNALGEKVDSGKFRTDKEGLRKLLDGKERRLVVCEAGPHSPWVSEAVAGWGHEVLVADPRRLPIISQNDRKNDRNDAELLARLGRADAQLLCPVVHRGKQAQADLAVLQARDGLVRARTQLVNQVRSLIKLCGERAPSSSTASFEKKVRDMLPAELKPAVEGLLSIIEQLTAQIKEYDKRIEMMCSKSYPETELLRAVAGVGPITSLAFVLTIETPKRFPHSRQVGAYLGLTPRQDQSGGTERALGITKAGNKFLRKLLVQAAQYALGPFGPDCDLRRYGMKLAGPVDAKGKHNKRLKRRAVIAVARKLSVLLHYLWAHGVVYDPLYKDEQRKKQPPKPEQEQPVARKKQASSPGKAA